MSRHARNFPICTSSAAIAAAALLAFGEPGAANAQGLGISIGGDDGLSVGVGIGDDGLSADASLGGDDGVNAGATVGGDSLVGADVSVGDTTSPGAPGNGNNPPPRIGDVILEGVSAQQLAAAQRMRCRQDGNSTVYNGYVAFGPDGRALGVVQDATVSRSLGVESLRMATMPRDGLVSSCVIIRTSEVRTGNGALVVPVSWDRLAGSLSR
jgi:hypothetical protein